MLLAVTAGNAALAPQYASVLPYKLLRAAMLVELGLLPQAAQYCHSILSGLQVRLAAPARPQMLSDAAAWTCGCPCHCWPALDHAGGTRWAGSSGLGWLGILQSAEVKDTQHPALSLSHCWLERAPRYHSNSIANIFADMVRVCVRVCVRRR